MRGVLFDLDGTLVDSSTDIAMSANAVREGLDLPPLDVAEVVAMVGDGLRALLQRLLPEGSDMARAQAIFAAHYDQQCTQHSDYFPGLVAVLRQLQQQQFRLGVVSNKPLRWCQAILNHLSHKHQLPADLWQIVVGGDGVKKPAPDPILAALARLQLPPAQVCMVGDHANDILAGRAAGCRSVYVQWGYAELPHGVVADASCADAVGLAAELGIP